MEVEGRGGMKNVQLVCAFCLFALNPNSVPEVPGRFFGVLRSLGGRRGGASSAVSAISSFVCLSVGAV